MAIVSFLDVTCEENVFVTARSFQNAKVQRTHVEKLCIFQCGLHVSNLAINVSRISVLRGIGHKTCSTAFLRQSTQMQS
jgi:hypothetical protein